ncbi:MAG: ABC transporter ATP-binding protein [bacterium]|nr:ABC transporter ATP-binding protein [bacterium]
MSQDESKKKEKKVSLAAVRREAKRVIWAYRWRLALGLVLLVVGRLCGMILPASSKYLIDEVIGKSRYDLLPLIAMAAGGGALVQAISSFSLAVLLGAAAQRSINNLRLRVQSHIGRLPIEFFENHKSGELISRIMTDPEGVRNLVGTGFVQLVGGVLTSAVAFSVLVWLNWRLTLITISFLVVFAIIMVIGFSRLRPLFRERGKINAEITGRLVESLNGAKIVKAYTAEAREEKTFSGQTQTFVDLVVKTVIGISSMSTVASLIFAIVSLTIGVLGVRFVAAEVMTVGDLFMFLIFTGLMVTPLVQMSAIGTQITEAFAGLDRINEILQQSTEYEDEEDRKALGELRGEVRFEDVWFEYKEGVPVLRDVSFEAPAGTTTALVGSSGAGKSTLIALVLTFRRPTRGRVLVDGEDLSGIRLKDYRSNLAVVLQDDFLFDGTLADNIAYSRPEATREEVLRVAKLAHCDEFIEGFPDGYDTIIGERGVKLSGGQRQRVSIARAMLADPRILVLDEATSSLDSESEQFIQEGLQELRSGRTTFVIAHRLSTIRDADQILVLEEGKIVEGGSHEELMASNGRYRELYEKQYRLESNRFLNPGETFADEDDERDEPDSKPKAASMPAPGLGGFGRGQV